MLYILTLIAVTLIYPIMLNGIKIGSFTLLNGFVSPGIDMKITPTSYLGLILIAGVFLALGTGISAMFQTNQIAAFFASFALFFFLWWLVGFPANVITGSSAEFFRYLDMQSHLLRCLEQRHHQPFRPCLLR